MQPASARSGELGARCVYCGRPTTGPLEIPYVRSKIGSEHAVYSHHRKPQYVDGQLVLPLCMIAIRARHRRGRQA